MPDKFYVCQCGCDAISVSDWSDDYGFHIETVVGLSMWRLGPGPYRYRWQQRLRLIWQILKYGHPWTDSVLLDEDKAREVASEILAITDPQRPTVPAGEGG